MPIKYHYNLLVFVSIHHMQYYGKNSKMFSIRDIVGLISLTQLTDCWKQAATSKTKYTNNLPTHMDRLSLQLIK